MPEILPYLDDAGNPVSPPKPGTVLFFDGTTWHVPRVDDDGRLQVRGEDQLFSYAESLSDRREAVVSGADGYLDSSSPPAGEVWVVTNAVAQDRTSPTTRHTYFHRKGVPLSTFHDVTAAFAALDRSIVHCHVYLDPTDVVRVIFTGSLVGDTCRVNLTGYVMTLET